MKIIILNPYYKVTEVSMQIYQWLSLPVNSDCTLYTEQHIIYFVNRIHFFVDFDKCDSKTTMLLWYYGVTD